MPMPLPVWQETKEIAKKVRILSGEGGGGSRKRREQKSHFHPLQVVHGGEMTDGDMTAHL